MFSSISEASRNAHADTTQGSFGFLGHVIAEVYPVKNARWWSSHRQWVRRRFVFRLLPCAKKIQYDDLPLQQNRVYAHPLIFSVGFAPTLPVVFHLGTCPCRALAQEMYLGESGHTDNRGNGRPRWFQNTVKCRSLQCLSEQGSVQHKK